MLETAKKLIRVFETEMATAAGGHWILWRPLPAATRSRTPEIPCESAGCRLLYLLADAARTLLNCCTICVLARWKVVYGQTVGH